MYVSPLSWELLKLIRRRSVHSYARLLCTINQHNNDNDPIKIETLEDKIKKWHMDPKVYQKWLEISVVKHNGHCKWPDEDNLQLIDEDIAIPFPSLETTNLNDLLKHADYISLHVPMPENKKPVITKSEFDIMKDGVMIVNAARGGVIDEDDLINAINNGKVAAAALDVFVGEPSPRADVLALANTSLTPHIGAATSEAQDRIGTELADKIKDFYQK